jgi:hypothetical protein
MSKRKIKGYDVIIGNRYDDDDFVMYAVVARNQSEAKRLALRYRDRATMGRTKRTKLFADINDTYKLNERDLKEKVGVKRLGFFYIK